MSTVQPDSREERDSKHLAAVARRLQWADEPAEHEGYADPVSWLHAVEAAGGELPHRYETKPHPWQLVVGANRSRG